MIKLTRRQKANIKIAGLTAVSIFTLATTFTTTYAWFASNRVTTVTGMNVCVKLGETDLSQLTVHRCDLSNSTKTTLKFFSTPSVIVEGHGSVVEASGVQMENYSTLNQSQPVLLLFTFSSEIYEDDLTITATTENTSFTEAVTAQNVSNFPFSSTVTFKVMSFTEENFPFDNVEIIDVEEDPEDPENPTLTPLYSESSFVTITGSGNGASYSYDDSLTLFSSNTHRVITYLAVILDYYPDAIEYIKGHTLNYAGIVLNNNNVINYFCDWTLEM